MAIDPGRRLVGAAALLLAAALAGCGGSSHSSTASTTTATNAAVQALSTTTSTARAHTSTKPRPAGMHPTTMTTSHSTTATATTASGTRTAPPPVPSGTPAAPDGLRQVTGYGSYELCAGQCTGGVPASLRRALHLPSGCPASGGGSPVAPSPADIQVSKFIGSSWQAARVEWVAAASYQGPVLIRGRRLDGPGAVGFGEGRVPDDELQLLHSGQQAPPVSGGSRAWLSFTRVRVPGCYAYQVDGTSFSRVIVFRAR